jgi:hypothetical protein
MGSSAHGQMRMSIEVKLISPNTDMNSIGETPAIIDKKSPLRENNISWEGTN